jgi:predicted DNA-binding transcriptional regulator AlpA
MTRRPARSPLPPAELPPEAPRSEADPLPPGMVHVSKPLAAVVDRLALRLDELAVALGVSRRAIERERSAGRFPRPDLTIGRMPLWRPETINEWIEDQSGKGVKK